LAGEQDETIAIISVVLNTIGRAFGSLWSPIIIHLFPVECFGFVFGMTQLISIPFQFAISPMTPFFIGRTFVPQILEYGNFSVRKLIFTL